MPWCPITLNKCVFPTVMGPVLHDHNMAFSEKIYTVVTPPDLPLSPLTTWAPSAVLLLALF